MIVTDHKPLTYLLTSKNLTGRLHRWKFSLLEFQFKITHRKGTQNVVADALSRIQPLEKNEKYKINIAQTRSKTANQTENKNNLIFFEERNNVLIECKNFDHVFYFFEKENCRLQKVLEHKLKTKINIPKSFSENNLFYLDDNRTIIKVTERIVSEGEIKCAENYFTRILEFCNSKDFKNIAFNVDFREVRSYFQFKFSLSKFVQSSNLKIKIFLNKVIDITAVNDINGFLETYHNTKLGGHTGFERMKNMVQRYFYWPTMSTDIKEFIKNCAICEKTKVKRHTRAPLQISSTASEPFEKNFLDLVGPINPPSENGNNYIFTCNFYLFYL